MRLRSLSISIVTAAALLVSASAFPGAARAQGKAAAQPTPAAAPEPTNTLDLTLDTGSPNPPAPSSSSAESSSGKTVVHRTMTGAPSPTWSQAAQAAATAAAATARAAQPLSSRGTNISREAFRQAPNSAPHVLAQLGLVLPAQLPLRLERSANSRTLSSVAKGTYLAVVSDGGDWWGVLMINNTMGWVPKQSVQMIAYQTEIALAAPPPAQEQTPAPSETDTPRSGAAGSVAGGLADNLDPRTTSLLREALTYLGVPYVWAGNTRAGLDCSGFVKAVFASQGVSLPRHSGDQAKVGQPVSGADIRPGDRLYFDMGRKGAVSHCGIYLGNGYFIHASTNHGKVDIDLVSKPNYARALVDIRRS